MKQLLLAAAALLGWAQGSRLDVRIPGVTPAASDLYLCSSVPVEEAAHIVGFQPHGDSHTAHHILVYGCAMPGRPDGAVWNCGEMAGESDYEVAPVCQAGSTILYAWARDAPTLKLPKDVGFKIGGDSGISHVVVQVHYMHPLEHQDYSGVTLNLTSQPISKRAGVLLMVTGGEMGPKSTENFETACVIDEDVELHPFAFRTHTHNHGLAVSGWRVTAGEDEESNKWELIGKKDPKKPQMFYPVNDNHMTISAGDILAARCHMRNQDDHPIQIGPSGANEMCNFYMMYSVEGDKILSDNTCFSPGPPNYYWAAQGGLNNIPDQDANSV